MGIEPTWDAAQRPTPDLKSGRATSALSTSGLQGSFTTKNTVAMKTNRDLKHKAE